MVNFFFGDYKIFIQNVPDLYYDWTIADIPYGIDVANMAYLKEINTTVKQKNGNKLNPNRNKKAYKQKDWDKQTPSQDYFDEIRRISKNQIVFGVNYVDWEGLGKGRIKWDKGVAEGMSFGRYEYAYCSSIDYEHEIQLLWTGMRQAKSLSEPMTQQGNKKLNEKRIHPCHKPVLLYKRLLLDFVEPKTRIIDTHGGGMSIAIAADEFGVDADICEIDEEYFNSGTNRYKLYKRQLKMF